MLRRVVVTVVALLLSGCIADGDGGNGPSSFRDADACPTADGLHTEEVSVPNLFGGGRVEGGQYEPYMLDVTGTTGWTAQEAACVEAIQVDLEWTNGPDAGADLYVGVVVPGTDTEIVGHDDQQFAGDGAHMETVLAPTQSFNGFSGEAMLEPLEVRIRSDWASLSQSGVDATLTVTLIV